MGYIIKDLQILQNQSDINVGQFIKNMEGYTINKLGVRELRKALQGKTCILKNEDKAYYFNEDYILSKEHGICGTRVKINPKITKLLKINYISPNKDWYINGDHFNNKVLRMFLGEDCNVLNNRSFYNLCQAQINLTMDERDKERIITSWLQSSYPNMENMELLSPIVEPTVDVTINPEVEIVAF